MTGVAEEGAPIMCVATGAYGNIGDVVIRRRAIGWVAGEGQLHVYVGSADEQWVDQLRLPHDAVCYSRDQMRQWLSLPLRRRAPRALVFDPGALPLSRHALPVEGLFLALCALVRLRGGVVLRPPRGVGGAHPLTLAVYRAAVRISQLTLWRTTKSLEIVGRGTLAPDTAFQERAVWTEHPDEERNLLVVSLRGRRAEPAAEWYRAIRGVAESAHLEVVAVAQVREDDERCRVVVERLRGVGVDARWIAWGDSTDREQEEILRAIYTRTALVVTDRLHVAILASVAGAVPVEYISAPSDKISSHFGQIGISGISWDADEVSSQQFIAIARDVMGRAGEIRRSLAGAGRDLDLIEHQVRNLVRSGR